MSTSFEAEWNQKVTFPSFRSLFGKLKWDKNTFNTFALSKD